jgi:hypothetical protein
MTITAPQIVWMLLLACMMLLWLVLVVVGPRRIDTPNVLAVLRYGVLLRTLALTVALAPPLMASYVLWVREWRHQATLNLAGISLLSLSVLAGLLLIEVTRVQIVLTDDGITRFSPWSGLAMLKWIEVERIRYSSINRWFVVTGLGQTIRVSRHLAGIGSFAETVRRKVAAERWTSAAVVFDAIA